MGKAKPTNMALYNRVKQQEKKKFKVWPSAYASGWLVKEYKEEVVDILVKNLLEVEKV